MDHPIDSFNGYFQFLNNDYPTWVMADGILFPSVTTAYQASRTNDPSIRKQIAQLEDYTQLKSIVMNIKNPPQWNSQRYKVMQRLVRDKFKRNKQIANKLIATKDRQLINKYPTDGDNQYYWGMVPTGSGHNSLGKILKSIRQQFIRGIDNQRWIQHHHLEHDPLMFPAVALVIEKDQVKIDKLFLQKKNCFFFGAAKESTFKLQHSSISKNHACIFFDNEVGVNLVDLNSTNGTYLDGVKINPLEPTKVNTGSTIIFGNSSRKYLIEVDRKNVQEQIKRKEKQGEESLKNIEKLKNTHDMSKEEIKNKIGYNLNNCLLLSNLHQRTSHHQLKQAFSEYGHINEVRMCIDRKTGKNQGTSILYFSSSKDAQSLIIKRPKIQVRGRLLEIKLIDSFEAENILNRFDIQKKQRDHHHQHRQRQRDYERERTRDKKDRR